MKNYCVKNLVTLAAIGLLGAIPVSASPINGNFASGLDNWTATGNISLIHDDDTGNNFVYFAGSDATLTSTLSQTFTLDAGTQTLSFEMTLFPPAGPVLTDVFTASLSGAGITDPLFYSLDDHDPQNQYTPAGTTVVDAAGRKTVNLDVSSLTAGGDINVLLAFALQSDNDGLVTSVNLYDVSTSGGNVPVVPVPTAFVLTLIGAAGVGLTRKLKVIGGI